MKVINSVAAGERLEQICELFDLSRWCSDVRRPGLLGGWASANILLGPARLSRVTRSRRVQRLNWNGATDAIDVRGRLGLRPDLSLIGLLWRSQGMSRAIW